MASARLLTAEAGRVKALQFGNIAVLVAEEEKPPNPSSLFKPTPEREAELAAMPYLEYLKSPEWKERRRVAINESESRCGRCRRRAGKSHLHLHHLTYERRGKEHPDDLVVLCEKCHAKEHGKEPA